MTLPPAGSCWPGVTTGKSRPLLSREVAEALRRAGPVGGDHHAVAPADQLDETVGETRPVAGDRTPAGRLDQRGVG